MKRLFFLATFILLFSNLFGQTSKPSVFIIPTKTKGIISEIQIKFLDITLNDSLSNYFDVFPPPQNKSGECLIGCNFFHLYLEEIDGDFRLDLTRKND